jgi:hypothetical protein
LPRKSSASTSRAAARLRDEARAVVEDFAAHAGELREPFLGQPVVAQLLEEN